MYMYVRNAMNGVGVGTNDYEYPILMLTTMNWPMPSMTNIYTMQLQKQLIWAGALKTSPLLTTNADSAWCQLLRVGTQTTSQPGAHLFSLRLSYRGIGSSSRSLMSQLASASCNRNTHTTLSEEPTLRTATGATPNTNIAVTLPLFSSKYCLDM